MAKVIEIIIHQADLGYAESEFGLKVDDLKLFDSKGNIRVNVFIDDELVDAEKKTNDSIAVKRLSDTDDQISTVIITTKDGEMLNQLRYSGNTKVKIDTPTDKDSTLNEIADALKRIADAIPPLGKR